MTAFSLTPRSSASPPNPQFLIPIRPIVWYKRSSGMPREPFAIKLESEHETRSKVQGRRVDLPHPRHSDSRWRGLQRQQRQPNALVPARADAGSRLHLRPDWRAPHPAGQQDRLGSAGNHPGRGFRLHRLSSRLPPPITLIIQPSNLLFVWILNCPQPICREISEENTTDDVVHRNWSEGS